MNGSSFELCSDHLVAYATWLRSRFGFMKSQPNTGEWLEVARIVDPS